MQSAGLPRKMPHPPGVTFSEPPHDLAPRPAHPLRRRHGSPRPHATPRRQPLAQRGGEAEREPAEREAVAAAVDALDPTASALRSVNTVVADPDGWLIGYSTDGDGLIASLRASGVAVAGRAICVLGGGGAARAICDALGRAGAARVAVVNRTAAAAEVAAALAVSNGVAVGAVGAARDIADAEIVVNATSVGMGTSELPCDPSLLHAGQVVADIVYHPRETALLLAARAVGAVTVAGLGMLVHQAALQQQLWHGAMPDVAVMSAAVA